MTKIINTLFLLTILSSCGFVDEKKNSDEQKKIDFKEVLRNKIINNLVSKYNIKYKWDTLTFVRSIKYKPIIESKYQLIRYFDINDIYEKDDKKFISIETSLYPTFYFDLQLTTEQESKLNEENVDRYLVVSISSIKKIKFAFEADIENSERAIIKLDDPDFFIGSGEIIEIVTIK